MSETSGSGSAPLVRSVVCGNLQGFINDPDRLFQDADNGNVCLYRKTDVSTVVDQAEMHISAITNELGNAAYRLQAAVQVRDSPEGAEDTFPVEIKDYYKSLIAKDLADEPIVLCRTYFSNLFGVRDVESGVEAFINVRDDGTLIILNDHTYTGAADSSRIEKIVAPPKYNTANLCYLMGFARIFMRTIADCHLVGSGGLDLDQLEREYQFSADRGLGLPPIEDDEVFEEEHLPEPSLELENVEMSLFDASDVERISLEDVAGNIEVVEKLRYIAESYKYLGASKEWRGKRPQGIVFYGPPGTGKSMLAQGLAHEMEADVWNVDTTSFVRKYMAESAAKLKELFDAARNVKRPTVILLDEFESLTPIVKQPAGGGVDSERNAAAALFKTEIEKVRAANPNVMFVAITNYYDSIDRSLIRPGRFDEHFYIGMPDADTLEGIFWNKIMKHELQRGIDPVTLRGALYNEQIDFSALARLMEDMTGADVETILSWLELKHDIDEGRNGVATLITEAEIMRSINDHKRHT